MAKCPELAVVTQEKTLEEEVEDLRQAFESHMRNTKMPLLVLAEHPRLQLIYHTTIIGR